MSATVYVDSGQYEHLLQTIKSHHISTAAVSDVLDGLGVVSTLNSRITLCNVPELANLPVFGQAHTIRWLPVRKSNSIHSSGSSTWQQVREFLCPTLEDGRGKVYVAGAGPLLTEGALAGGMSCTYFQEKLKFEGVILGGAVRDCEQIRELHMPVYSSNYIPTDTQGAWLARDSGGECVIDNVAIKNGDWILADLNGVVVIPPSQVSEILQKAKQIEENESRTLAKIRAGANLVELIEGGNHI